MKKINNASPPFFFSTPNRKIVKKTSVLQMTTFIRNFQAFCEQRETPCFIHDSEGDTFIITQDPSDDGYKLEPQYPPALTSVVFRDVQPDKNIMRGILIQLRAKCWSDCAYYEFRGDMRGIVESNAAADILEQFARKAKITLP
jgi:hypothetical protein